MVSCTYSTFAVVEVIGYFARAKAHNETDRLFPYIIQNVFLLLPPVLFAATVYMTLSRIIKAARGEAYTLLPARLITKTFVWSDVISFLVQGGGAGMMATGTSLANTGQWIVVGGLLIQILMFGFFIVISTVFHHRYKTRSVRAVVDPGYVWKTVLYMVYCVSILIMIRSIYRVCEFVLGQDGYMMSHEWVLYVFDSVTMFIVMVIFYLRFPDKLGDEISKGERVNSLELFSTGPSAGVVQRDCSTEGPKY